MNSIIMKSINFEFLRERWPELASLGGFAEQYTASDPASAMVKLRLFSALREIAGAKEVEVEGDGLSIKETLQRFAKQYGDRAQGALFDKQGELLPSVLLLVNGEAVEQGGATRVKSGDMVAVLLPTAGG